MKIIVFDTHHFEENVFIQENKKYNHQLKFLETRLNPVTASLALGHDSVCAFVNDCLNREVLSILKENGIKIVSLRSAGFNHVDLVAAHELGITITRVPEYSPYAVAEHATGMILCLNRKIHKAYNRVREGNFSLDGLVGFDMHEKTVGVIGTGRIGKAFIQIMLGFGCIVKAHDIHPDDAFAREKGFQYYSFKEVIEDSDIISLHIPLSKQTIHLIDQNCFMDMKAGAMLINTSRGKLIDTRALISSLKSGHLGAAGLDVYEEEENFFFRDHSFEVLTDDVLTRLMTFPNVLLTSHQAFLTKEALENIARTALRNISDFEEGRKLDNEVL